MRVKRRDAEQWMSHRLLPESLRDRIRRYEQYKWQETRGVDEENLLRNLPKDLRRDIKRHLCLALLMRVSFLDKILFLPVYKVASAKANFLLPGANIWEDGWAAFGCHVWPTQARPLHRRELHCPRRRPCRWDVVYNAWKALDYDY